MTDRENDITGWFTGRLPDEWATTSSPEITVDRDEIVIIVALAPPELDGDPDASTRTEAVDGRIDRFRDETRDRRVDIARAAEHRFERKVSWGARIEGRTMLFTHVAAPTMTRLRQPERRVLDTLIAAGVARSRADALAWCVRLVGDHTDDWLTRLRAAIDDVERIRADGPDAA